MAMGYWVVFADVTDPEGYKGYMAANAKALAKYGGRFLARGGNVEPKEGKPRSRVVVVEFPSYSAALECYRSPEYVSAMKERRCLIFCRRLNCRRDNAIRWISFAS